MTSISFEFFPPKSEAAGEKLWKAIGRLAPLRPDFVSVTYGAGGSTRDRTHQCIKRIIDETDLKPAAHLTCVAASKTDVDSVVDDYAAAGVQHIVALRGDMPDMGAFQPHAEGYDGSVALVAALAKRGGFDITVSAYPEKHPESASLTLDIDLLKAKLTPEQAAPSRNLCSTRRRICGSATLWRLPVLVFRSFRALCRPPILPAPNAWRRLAARPCRIGWPPIMTVWKMTRIRASILPHLWRLTNAVN